MSQTVAWAIGQGGTVWRSVDGGNFWELKFEDKNINAIDVHFLNDGLSGWIIGYVWENGKRTNDAALLITSDGGSNWNILYRISGEPIENLYFWSKIHGCFASRRAIHCTKDGGQTWFSKPSATNSYWSGLYFLDDGLRGWAWATLVDEIPSVLSFEPKPYYAAKGAFIVATTDGGQTWAQTGKEIKEQIGALTFLSNGQTGWALAGKLVDRNQITNTVLYTTNGGVSWQPLADGLSSGLRDFHFSSDGHSGWAIGSNLANQSRYIIKSNEDYSETWAYYSPFPNTLEQSLILHTADGGKTWIPESAGTEDQLVDLSFLPNTSDGWAIGQRGSLIRTHDGTHWEVLTKAWIDNFRAVRFLTDGNNGWALSDIGTILHTGDGGHHWYRQSYAGVYANDLYMDSTGQHGWVLGDALPHFPAQVQVVSTDDGGRDWKRSSLKSQYTILRAYLVSADTAWAIGELSASEPVSAPKYLIVTNDRGQSWHVQQVLENDLSRFASYSLADRSQGWIMISGPALFHTADNGTTWTEIKSESLQNTGYKINALTFVADGKSGWAVGDIGSEDGSHGKCLIIHTIDGGRTWKRQDNGKLDGTFNSVNFLDDGLRGWAVGSGGLIAYTSDGGENWQLQSSSGGALPNLQASDFISDNQEGLRGWIVGDYGTILRSVSAKPHPIVEQYQVASSATGVQLKWRIAEDELWRPEDLKWQIDYCSQKNCVTGSWQQILDWSHVKPERSDGYANFSYKWNPADNGIGAGTDINYRIRIDDGRQKLAHQELGPHTYQPLWSRLAGWQQAVVIVVAVILGYIIACSLLLWLYPWALFWLNEHVSLREFIEPWVPANLKGLLPTTLAFVPWFAKHQRVNQAWATRYLAQDTRTFVDLSPAIRKHYIQREVSLDAWVSRHLAAAQDVFLRLPTVVQRNIHIFMPICIETEDKNTLIDQPQPKDIRPFMQASRFLLSVVGIGGAGKSSLACQFGRWSMSPIDEQRLSEYRMIPVLIAEDTTDLLRSIKEQLDIIAGNDLPDDLLHNLLSKKRILIIVEALSEKSREMQEHLSTIYGKIPVNALIVTTRRSFQVLGGTQISVRPEEITVDRLAYFLLEYLRSSKRDHLFPRRKALELADRLLSIAEADGKDLPLTPLLIVLFVQQAIELAEKDCDLRLLPGSIPETMIKYIKQLNANKTLPEQQLIDSTLLVARQSLGENYNPHEFERRRAMVALKDANCWSDAYDILEELSDCGVLERRESAGTTLYRFKFDPVAEYIAALERVNTLGDDANAWEKWLHVLKGAEGYPKGMDGFLTALEVCISTYQKEFNLPTLQLRESVTCS